MWIQSVLPLPDGMCVGARAVVLLQPGCSQAACEVLEGLEHVVLSLLAAGLKALSLQKRKIVIIRENGTTGGKMTCLPARPGEHKCPASLGRAVPPGKAVFQE